MLVKRENGRKGEREKGRKGEGHYHFSMLPASKARWTWGLRPRVMHPSAPSMEVLFETGDDDDDDDDDDDEEEEDGWN